MHTCRTQKFTFKGNSILLNLIKINAAFFSLFIFCKVIKATISKLVQIILEQKIS